MCQNTWPQLAAHGIDTIDLLVVNLYPFVATVAKPDCTLEDAIENIDIGGPAMVRSAAKNWKDVAVLTDARPIRHCVDRAQSARQVVRQHTLRLGRGGLQSPLAITTAAISDYFVRPSI
jgi:phosphoribosylaminoimidazolecarboxamide formyltransferase/IMP cyclohydrolase